MTIGEGKTTRLLEALEDGGSIDGISGSGNTNLQDHIVGLIGDVDLAKQKIIQKGGAAGDTGLEGLASEIASIPSSGGGEKDYGHIKYYSEWDITVEAEMEMECTVSSVDSAKFLEFKDEKQLGNMVNFMLEDGTWNIMGRPEIRIAPEDMESTTGISVVAESDWCEFEIKISTTVDTTSEILELELDSNFDKLTYDNRNSETEINGTIVLPLAITEIVIGKDVTDLPESFCNDFTCLNTVNLSGASGVRKIPNYAFSNSGSIQSISMPPSPYIIGDTVFSGLGLNTNIGEKTFDFSLCEGIGDSFMTGANIPNATINFVSTDNKLKLRYIGRTFLQMAYIGKVIFTNSSSTVEDNHRLRYIGDNFFYTCYTNVDTTIPYGVRTIGANAFGGNGCKFNRRVVFPNTVLYVGENFLSYNTNFNSDVVLTSRVTKLGSGFMNGCTNFTSTLVLAGSNGNYYSSSLGYNPPCTWYESLMSTSNTAPIYTTGFTVRMLNTYNANQMKGGLAGSLPPNASTSPSANSMCGLKTMSYSGKYRTVIENTTPYSL